jgi:hypothetical protein
MNFKVRALGDSYVQISFDACNLYRDRDGDLVEECEFELKPSEVADLINELIDKSLVAMAIRAEPTK